MNLVFCGPPATGKTTVAERLRHRFREVRLLHSDDFSRDTYDRLYERVADADSDADWILDGTFYRRALQERFRALPDAHLVHFTASLDAALARNRERADSIDEQGLRVMHAEFETPDNPDLTLDTERSSVEECVDALERYVVAWTEAGERRR